MITLYIKTPCQYSARAMAALDVYDVPFTKKDIADPVNEQELLTIGGKHKVPFLVDGEVHLYESEDIVAYVEKKYGSGTTDPILTFSKGSDTCSIE